MVKRFFDIVLSIIGLFIAGWLVVCFYVIIRLTTGESGFFLQKRIGRFGVPFTIYKLTSMAHGPSGNEVTPVGRFIRKYKIDELPQLVNILMGDMSFVGPRPDLPGYYDLLQGNDRSLLNLRPGLTGPASIKYAKEEQLLTEAKDPVYLNDFVIFPDKVRLNLIYYKKQNLWLDIKLLFCTVFRILPSEFKA